MVADDERCAYLCVVLEQVLVLSLIVHVARLMLTKSVEGFVFGTIEHELPRITVQFAFGKWALRHAYFAFGNSEGMYARAAFRFFQQELSCIVVECHATCLTVNEGFQFLGSEHDGTVFLGDGGTWFLSSLRHNDEALLRRERLLGCSAYTDDAVRHSFHADVSDAVSL